MNRGFVCVCVWVGTGGTDMARWEGWMDVRSEKRRGRGYWVHSPAGPLSPSLNNIPPPQISSPTHTFLRLARVCITVRVCVWGESPRAA